MILKFTGRVEKILAGSISAMSIQKEHAIQSQNKRKRTTATENQAPKAEKS